ncbi:MAG: hypothetical protein ACK56F_07850 [bacterium]
MSSSSSSRSGKREPTRGYPYLMSDTRCVTVRGSDSEKHTQCAR